MMVYVYDLNGAHICDLLDVLDLVDELHLCHPHVVL